MDNRNSQKIHLITMAWFRLHFQMFSNDMRILSDIDSTITTITKLAPNLILLGPDLGHRFEPVWDRLYKGSLTNIYS